MWKNSLILKNSAWSPGFLVKSNEGEPVEANALVTFCMLHENGSIVSNKLTDPNVAILKI